MATAAATGEVKKRVAILGGSFDPPTESHFMMAAAVLQTKAADEVWVTPCGARPDKASLVTSALHRYIMCCIGIESRYSSQMAIKVCDAEIFEPKSIPTYFLMKKLEEKYPELDLYFILGTDLIKDLKQWDEGEKLWNEIGFLLYPRIGYDVGEMGLPPKCRLVEFSGDDAHLKILTNDYSSTEFRKRLRTGDRTLFEGIVPLPVMSYALRNNLYPIK